MFTFFWPWMILLLPLPWIIQRLFRVKNDASTEENVSIRFPTIDRLKKAFSSYSTIDNSEKKDLWKKIFFFLIWLCLVLSLMRPQIVDQHTQVENEGRDIVLAVDLSGSMRALDFSTNTQMINRLDATKAVVNEFVKKRQGDRIGLILFGTQAFLHVPLTLDTISVGNMLNNAVIGMAGEETSIGDALGLAVKTLRERPEKSRVVILLTDGTDTASTVPPLQAADLAKQYNIRVYTIGIGTKDRIPIQDQFGRIIMTYLPVDEGLLKEIAKLTGGTYFNASDRDRLEAVYEQIDRIETTKADVKQYLIRKPLFRYPLGFAMGLLMLFTVINLLKGVRFNV